MTLEELIDQQIALGHKNPHDIPDLLNKAMGDELQELIKPYLADFIADMARRKMNQMRHSSVIKITTKNLADPEIKLRSMWVPSSDGTIIYKRIGDMTANDFEARAGYLNRMATGIHKHAQWCLDVAEAIRHARVKTAGKLAHLPALRDIED